MNMDACVGQDVFVVWIQDSPAIGGVGRIFSNKEKAEQYIRKTYPTYIQSCLPWRSCFYPSGTEEDNGQEIPTRISILIIPLE